MRKVPVSITLSSTSPAVAFVATRHVQVVRTAPTRRKSFDWNISLSPRRAARRYEGLINSFGCGPVKSLRPVVCVWKGGGSRPVGGGLIAIDPALVAIVRPRPYVQIGDAVLREQFGRMGIERIRRHHR